MTIQIYLVPPYGKSAHPALQGDEATYNKAKKEIQLRVVNVLRKLSVQIGEYFLHIPDDGKLLKKFLKFVDEEIVGTYPAAQCIKTSLIKRVHFICHPPPPFPHPSSCISSTFLSLPLCIIFFITN